MKTPIPVYYDNHPGVPICTEDCPSHDGKRCEILGRRPAEVCIPKVEEMAKELGFKQPTDDDEVDDFEKARKRGDKYKNIAHELYTVLDLVLSVDRMESAKKKHDVVFNKAKEVYSWAFDALAE
jgi:hypothetical protein